MLAEGTVQLHQHITRGRCLLNVSRKVKTILKKVEEVRMAPICNDMRREMKGHAVFGEGLCLC